MSLKYGLPLIFGSIGTFFIANMFEGAPDLEIDILPEEVPKTPDSEPVLENENNAVFHESSPKNIPAPVYHAPVYHAPVYHAPIAPTPVYHPPAPMPVYEPPVHNIIQPKPVVLQPSPIVPKPVVLQQPPILPKINKKSISSVSTGDPLSIKENLDLEKSKAASEKEALRVVTAAKKRAEELRNPVKPSQIPVTPNKLIAFPPLAPPKADIRLRGYSETDANLATLPPVGKIKPVNIDASPLSPGEIPKLKLKQDGGKRISRKLKNLAHAMDLDDPYDRY